VITRSTVHSEKALQIKTRIEHAAALAERVVVADSDHRRSIAT
jgi:hypothetical protein